MKYHIVSLIIIIILSNSSKVCSQDFNYDKSAKLKRIYDGFAKKKYYDTYYEINEFLLAFPNQDLKDMFYNRGLLRAYLSDFHNMEKDFMKARDYGYNIPEAHATYNLFDKIRIVREKKKTSIVPASVIQWYLSDSIKANTFAYTDSSGIILNAQDNYRPIITFSDTLKGSLRKERTCFDVKYYNLSITISPEQKHIAGSCEIHFKVLSQTNKIQIDLYDNMNLDSIVYMNKKLEFERIHNAVFIKFPATLSPDNNLSIKVFYEGNPIEAIYPPWFNGTVWEKSRGKKYWLGVACEHMGASIWWPNKDHLSDKPDSMSICLEVPQEYIAVSNGNLISTEYGKQGYKKFNWHVSYPINNYNVTFYVGNFKKFSEEIYSSGNPISIDYFVLPHNLKKAKEFYSHTKDFVEYFEDAFGNYPYLKDGLAFIESPYAGMEHQSAIAIGDLYDTPPRYGTNYSSGYYTLMHETAHEWWGNAIAVGDMADAWISEGFTTYAQLMFCEKKHSKTDYFKFLTNQMEHINNLWPIVGKRGVNDNTFLSGDIYGKGAMVLHNLRCIINNDAKFYNLLKDFYKKHKFKTIDSKDFVKFTNGYLKKDFSAFFNKFLYDSEPPVLDYYFSIVDSTLFLKYKWTKVDEDFEMPFSICLNNDTCIRIEATTKSNAIRFDGITDFYIPNSFRYKSEILNINSFTYFWTNWNNDELKIIKYGNDITASGYSIDSIRQGKWYYFKENEPFKMANFLNDKLHGEVINYKNRIAISISNYNLGTLDGKYVVYGETTKTIEGYFKEGKKKGEWIYRHPNGCMKAKGTFSNNKKHGFWKYYNEKEQCIAKGNFKEGKPVTNSWKYYNTSGVTIEKPARMNATTQPPYFCLGDIELYKQIYSRLQIHDSIFEIYEGEKIYVSCFVEPNSELTDFKVEKSFSNSIAEQLIAIMQQINDWMPGNNKGNPVSIKYYLPLEISREKINLFNSLNEN